MPKGEKETLRSIVAELEGRCNNTSNRVENGDNQDGDDKSFHCERRLTLNYAITLPPRPAWTEFFSLRD